MWKLYCRSQVKSAKSWSKSARLGFVTRVVFGKKLIINVADLTAGLSLYWRGNRRKYSLGFFGGGGGGWQIVVGSTANALDWQTHMLIFEETQNGDNWYQQAPGSSCGTLVQGKDRNSFQIILYCMNCPGWKGSFWKSNTHYHMGIRVLSH